MGRRLLILAAALAASALPAGPASAARTPAVGLRAIGHWPHGYYVYPARAGTLLHGTIEVVNTGTAAGRIRLYPADSTTGQTSGAVYLTSTATPHKTGAWISLSITSTQLQPGAKKRVAFVVHVPAGASPGQHLAGIVAEPVQEQLSTRSSGKTSVQIKVRSLAIVALEVDIPGALHAGLSIGAIKPGGSKGIQQLLLRLTNTGNVMLKPSGTLTISRPSGQVLRRLPLQLDTFLPHTSINYPVIIGRRGLPTGTYQTSVELHYAGQNGGGSGTTRARPPLTINANYETQVYGQTTPTGNPSPAASRAGHGQTNGGLSPLLFAAIAAGVLILLVGVYLLGRRRR